MLKALVDVRVEPVDDAWDCTGEGVGADLGQLPGVASRLHCLSKDTPWIVWRSGGHLLLETPDPVDLVDEREVAAEVPHEQFRGLAADARGLATG